MNEIAKCRHCGREWDYLNPDKIYWAGPDMCHDCAVKSMSFMLSGWHDLMKKIEQDNTGGGTTCPT